MGGTPTGPMQSQAGPTDPAAAIAGIKQLLAQLAQARQAAGQGQPGQQQVQGATVPQLPQSGSVQPAVAPPPQMAQAPAAIAPRTTQPGTVTGTNAQTRNAGVASSAIDNIGAAVYQYKAKKQQDAVAKAQSSYQQYQTALSQGDMQTANYIATDPKVIASWEKYLNEYITKVPGGPQAGASGRNPAGGSPMPGVNQPGGLAVPRNMNPPDPMKQAQLQSEQSLAASRQAEANEHTSKAKENDIEGNTKVVEANANLLARQAEAAAAQVKADEAKAQMARIPAENAKDKAEAAKNYAEAAKDLAEAKKAASEAGEKKSLTAFNAASNRIKDERNFAAKDLSALQSQASKDRGPIDKLMGNDPDVTPEMQAVGQRVKALSLTNSTFNSMQDDIVNGKITVQDAQDKARRQNGLTQDYQMWGGIPAATKSGTKIPPTPPKSLPEGTVVNDSDGTPLAAVMNGRWVAP